MVRYKTFALTLFWLALSTPSAFAHYPFMSFFNLSRGEDNVWRLNAVLAQASVSATLSQLQAEQSGARFTREEQEKELTNYLLDTVKLKVDGVEITLTPTVVNLGDHETRVVFELNNAPKYFHRIDASIRSFSDDANHHNILTLFQKAGRSKVVLSSRNNYSSQLNAPEKLAEGS
ncbi:hypothetical protein EUZ85_07655 [Hahella sp. KA22]|uniref:hypothetical protein n=1 Tax=Hahella sp. KA22 TaxID=1628392 RepID=UPI000FDF5031|nr:hypothetical protein [Hahella sp. KA22]AZZ90600.1 hypothetical protein ENC22_05105 [Hahella sp. KA22]QAY53970.1 hypothetical protein EUZ85_07655 [Hahella sp. KA22]